MIALDDIAPDRPVLIAGPTASGKSGLALEIAERQGGIIVNADALQVYDGWRILTARPSDDDLRRAPHALYGHVPLPAPYSAGDWLRDVTPYLNGPQRPIIVGGTGLNFAALTQGLAQIPPTPPEIRAMADGIPLPALIADLDSHTAAGLDLKNRARVQRAWEVARSTGRSIAEWQAETPPPLLPLSRAHALVLRPERNWLADRIARRWDAMIAAGAVDEAREILSDWNPDFQSSRAIGAAELIAYLRGTMTLEEASDAVVIATRQYAKRQRTWMRNRMRNWEVLELP